MSRSSARNAARGVPKRPIATSDLPDNEKKESVTPDPPSPSLIGAGVNTALDHAEGMIDNYKNRINTNIIWKTKYLSPASNKYICSKYNKVN